MSSSKSTRQKGASGEKLALSFLKKQKYKILETNYNCPAGEIDIIALKKRTLVFIEVKFRKSLEYGYPEESVNYPKQKKIALAAMHYLKQKGVRDIDLRFDVVSILQMEKESEIKLFENAFESPF